MQIKNISAFNVFGSKNDTRNPNPRIFRENWPAKTEITEGVVLENGVARTKEGKPFNGKMDTTNINADYVEIYFSDGRIYRSEVDGKPKKDYIRDKEKTIIRTYNDNNTRNRIPICVNQYYDEGNLQLTENSCGKEGRLKIYGFDKNGKVVIKAEK